MRHVIALNNPWVSSVVVNEYHLEVATLASGTTIGEISSGDDENWTAILVGIKSLFGFLKCPSDGWAWTPNGTRRSSLKQCIMAGQPIDASIFYSIDGSKGGITIIDGRHRIAVLEILGAMQALIMVPSSQTKLFLEAFP